MLLRAAAYSPNGARLGVLPTPQALSGSLPFGDVGAFSIDYPANGPKSPWLAGACEVALEVSYDGGLTWAEPNDARYLRIRRKGDQVDKPQVVSYEGPSYLWLLEKSKVLPEGALNADGKRPFLTKNAGAILRTLIQEAKARGELPGLDVTTFSEDNDSSGAAWAKVITLYYEPGVSYLTILLNLQSQGMLDFTMAGRSLRVYNADTTMAGDSGARLIRGRDLTEAPYQATLEGVASHVFLAGDKGLTFERANPTAPTPWGRWTSYISQGGVTDTGTMTVLTDAALDLASGEREENTYGLDFTRAKYLPFRDYSLGEEVTVTTDAGSEPLRLRQITLERDTEGRVKGNVVLNDRFLENDVRQNRRVQGITGGATADGGSGAQPAPDKPDRLAPKAPTGLAFASDAYLDDEGKVWATIVLSWNDPTQNTDNTALTDLEALEVYWRLEGDPTWTLATVVDAGVETASVGGFYPATNYEMAVRALDDSGNRSAMSAAGDVVTAQDATVPTRPSQPAVTVYLGQLLIEWDGKVDGNADGIGDAPPPSDFATVEVHVGATTGFVPSAATLVDTITAPSGGSTVATGLTYDAIYAVKLVMTDRAGNRSPESFYALGQPKKAATGDIQSITANQITAGAMSAAITVSGRIATALTGARVEINGQGIKQYNAGGVLTVDIPVTGTPVFSGTIKSAQSGPRVEVGDSITLGGTVPSGVVFLYSGVASETSPGQIYTAVEGAGSTADAKLVIASPRKNSLAASTITMASRDADTGADITFDVANGSYYWQSDSGFGTHWYRVGSTAWAVLYRNGSNGMILSSGSQVPYLALGSTDANLYGETVKILGYLDHSSGLLKMTDSTGRRRLAGGPISGTEYVQSDLIYDRTGAAASAVHVNSQGTLYRLASSERYKVAIDRSWADSAPVEGVLGLTPATYYDRVSSEQFAEFIHRRMVMGEEGDDLDALEAHVALPVRHLGLIAEDVHALGLTELVEYDDQGRPDAVHYDRLALYLLPMVQELWARVRDLESAR